MPSNKKSFHLAFLKSSNEEKEKESNSLENIKKQITLEDIMSNKELSSIVMKKERQKFDKCVGETLEDCINDFKEETEDLHFLDKKHAFNEYTFIDILFENSYKEPDISFILENDSLLFKLVEKQF
jgi:hypothetical protein